MFVENLIQSACSISTGDVDNKADSVDEGNSIDDISLDKDKLYRTLLPSALVAMKTVVSSKSFIVLKGFYVLLSVFVVYVMIFTSIRDYDDYGVFYIIFYDIQGLLYLVSPYVCVNALRLCLENDFIAYVLSDAYSADPKLNRKFAAFTHLNLLLLFCTVLTFTVTADLSLLVRMEAGISSICYLTPYVLVYSWFVCLVYAQWGRLEIFSSLLRHARSDSEARYHANIFPFLFLQQQDQQQKKNQKEEQEDEEACRQSGSIECHGPVSPSAAVRIPMDNVLTTEALGTKYYEELTVCLALTKCCGLSLFFFTMFALALAISGVWALYLQIYYVGDVFAFVVIAMIQIFELGFLLSCCNESGNLVCREVCSYLLSESSQRRRVSKSYQEATFLLGCIAHAKLEISYFGNFSLRSRTLLAIFGSIVGALIPGIILNSS